MVKGQEYSNWIGVSNSRLSADQLPIFVYE